jgi:STE24 endopeptidase
LVKINLLLIAFLLFFGLRSLFQLILNRLNIVHMRRHGRAIPDDFKDIVDEEKFKTMAAYTVESSRFGIISTLVDQAFFLLILLSGILPWWVEKVAALEWGMILGGLLFFAFLGLLPLILDIPFSLYETFGIENRYGFNTRTLKIWVMDFFKNLILSSLLGGLLLAFLLYLVSHGGKFWWITAWVVVTLFEMLIMWLYPVLLAPLFNRFEPLENRELVQRISDLMAKAGLKTRGVFRMDASRRSKHTNAYFTGLGKSKRIVLFDTLLNSHPEEEILAILSHEVGHWKKKHIRKQVILVTGISLVGFFLVSRLLGCEIIYSTFGFTRPTPYVGLFLIAALFSPPLFFAQPLEASFSRRFEREADDFAVALTQAKEPLIRSLKRLAADNLANLTPHPAYAWFYYSHPPMIERIERLKGKG